jgi:hypothetical protein
MIKLPESLDARLRRRFDGVADAEAGAQKGAAARAVVVVGRL